MLPRGGGFDRLRLTLNEHLPRGGGLDKRSRAVSFFPDCTVVTDYAQYSSDSAHNRDTKPQFAVQFAVVLVCSSSSSSSSRSNSSSSASNSNSSISSE
jgi:hypothetical protein